MQLFKYTVLNMPVIYMLVMLVRMYFCHLKQVLYQEA